MDPSKEAKHRRDRVVKARVPFSFLIYIADRLPELVQEHLLQKPLTETIYLPPSGLAAVRSVSSEGARLIHASSIIKTLS
jgi:hypothetical protein